MIDRDVGGPAAADPGVVAAAELKPSGAGAATYLVALAVLGAAVFAVEACLVLPGHLLAAQIVDAVLVLLLVNMGARSRSQPSADAIAAIAALRALALVPLIRVVSLGLPARDWEAPVSVLLIALAVGAAAVRFAPAVRVARGWLLLPQPTPRALYSAVAGAALGLVAYLCGAPPLWAQNAAPDKIWLAVAAGVCAAVVEEIVFRGVVQRTFERAAGTVGVVAASALFASTYLDAGTASLVLVYALAGFVFARNATRTGSLAGAMAGHVLLAVGAGAIWPTVFDRTLPVELSGPVTVMVLTVAITVVAALTYRPPH